MERLAGNINSGIPDVQVIHKGIRMDVAMQGKELGGKERRGEER